MAHKKAGGSTTLGRDSIGKRLGIKIHDGQQIKAGGIIVRQRGTIYHPGKNTDLGKDYTVFAKVAGIVKYTTKKIKKFNNQLKATKFVNVIPHK